MFRRTWVGSMRGPTPSVADLSRERQEAGAFSKSGSGAGRSSPTGGPAPSKLTFGTREKGGAAIDPAGHQGHAIVFAVISAAGSTDANYG